MARRKNTKFIDPRYFMDEKTERLDEELESVLSERAPAGMPPGYVRIGHTPQEIGEDNELAWIWVPPGWKEIMGEIAKGSGANFKVFLPSKTGQFVGTKFGNHVLVGEPAIKAAGENDPMRALIKIIMNQAG